MQTCLFFLDIVGWCPSLEVCEPLLQSGLVDRESPWFLVLFYAHKQACAKFDLTAVSALAKPSKLDLDDVLVVGEQLLFA
jgi:hypothetical protein